MNRFRKKSLRLPLTADTQPLLGVAFLLLLFMVYIQQASKHKILDVYFPIECGWCFNNYGCSCNSTIMNIILDSNHQFYCYRGLGQDPCNPPIYTPCRSLLDLRQQIIAYKKEILSKIQLGELNPMFDAAILIKPTDYSTMLDFVDVMDEMAINKINRYSFVEINETEKILLRTVKGI